MRSLIVLFAAACTPLDPIDTDRATDVDPGTSDVDTTDFDTSDPDTDDLDTQASDCDDDPVEDDDIVDDAVDVALPADVSGTICRNDPDYVRVTTERRCELSATLTFSEDEGDLDLILYKDGVGIASSLNGTSEESLTWTADADGSWVLGIEGRTNAENEYDLVVSEDCGAVCQDDDREDNDVQAQASTLIDQVEVVGRACEGDPDWFVVNAGIGCRLNYTVTPVIQGTLDATLVGPQGPLADAENRGGQLVLNAIVSGQHWIEITSTVDANYGMQGSASQCSSSPVSCPSPDLFEPNNDRTSAPYMSWATRIGASSCGDDDWYRLPASPGCTGIIDLSFSHNNGDLDVQFVNSVGQVIASGESETSNERVEATLPAGEVYVRVFGFGGSQNSYSLNTGLLCR